MHHEWTPLIDAIVLMLMIFDSNTADTVSAFHDWDQEVAISENGVIIKLYQLHVLRSYQPYIDKF
jgi:hypothetical protein